MEIKMVQLNDIKQSEIDAQKVTYFWSEANRIICYFKSGYNFDGCKKEYATFPYKNKECLLGDYDKLADITGL